MTNKGRAEEFLGQTLSCPLFHTAHRTAPWEMVLKALLHDAGTYDKAGKTGGANGSLRLELDRPENAALKEVVEQVSEVKAALDGSDIVLSPISWSDTLVLTGLVSQYYYCTLIQIHPGLRASWMSITPILLNIITFTGGVFTALSVQENSFSR